MDEVQPLRGNVEVDGAGALHVGKLHSDAEDVAAVLHGVRRCGHGASQLATGAESLVRCTSDTSSNQVGRALGSYGYSRPS